MAIKGECSVCAHEREHGVVIDQARPKAEWGRIIGVSKDSVRRHFEHGEVQATKTDGYRFEKDDTKGTVIIEKRADRIIPLSEWLDDLAEQLRVSGAEEKVDDFLYSVGHSVWTQHTRDQVTKTLYANTFKATLKSKRGTAPSWPVVHPADPVIVTPSAATERIVRIDGLQLALKCADPQIGFRVLADGSLDPFHDDKAIAVFIEAVRAYQPDKVTILGDFLDLPSQGRFAQEAAFARTTQLAVNRGYQFLAEIRAAAPDATIILVEGNHDLRMQNFIQNNALAAFGLRQADMPESWPVMSLPSLLRLDELNVKYIDAYPAATDWDNDLTRNIHGTKANSKGSTMSQYIHELPHVNTWAGHTHRCEIVYRTVLGARGEAIESYAANPGVLCRTDGAVPSVNGAIGTDGTPAKIVEDWQAGFGILYYNETESWPAVYRIRNGVAIVDGYRISA